MTLKHYLEKAMVETVNLPTSSFENPDIEIDASNIIQALEMESPSSPLFTKAVEYIKSKAFWNNQIIPLREIIILSTTLDRKIIDWLSQQTFLSRARNASTDSRARIALTAWLLGSPKGTLFTKNQEGKYSFVEYIESLLVDWKSKNIKEQELGVLKIKMILNLIINNMEIRLPNPSAYDELREIYYAALELIEKTQQNHSWTSKNNDSREHDSIGESAIATYEKEDLLGREMIFFKASFLSIYLIQFHGWSPRNEVQCIKAIISIQTHLIAKQSSEELIAVYKTTHNFRLNRGKALAKSGIFSNTTKEKSLNKMIEIFYNFYYKRLYHTMLNERNDKNGQKELEKAITDSIGGFSAKQFIKDLISYYPHKITDYMVDISAHQAELDTFTHTLKILPDDALDSIKLSKFLRNILGSPNEPITYHPMDNCQGYVLAIIDEILRRLGITRVDLNGLNPKEIEKFKLSISHLETYLMGLPHHPMHVSLSGSIRIRLANLFMRFEELEKTIADAEAYFIKGYKLFYSQGNLRQQNECIGMSVIFLKKYLETKDAEQTLLSGSTLIREPAFLPPHPHWKARIGLAVLLENYNYKNYENVIAKKIADGIDEIIIKMELKQRNRLEKQRREGVSAEFSESNHQGTTKFLRYISEIIMNSYDGIFDVSIARANQHKPRMGDFTISEEVPIGYGYTALIEYPLENSGMIEYQFHPGTHCPEDIYRLFTGIVTRHLRDFIIRISNPKVLSQFLSPAERKLQEEQQKDTHGYIDLEKYALFHEIFVEWSEAVKPLIYHQKKYKNEILVGSEVLVRFQNPDTLTEQLLPIDQVFAFLDLFEQYKPVSRRILSNAITEATTLDHPFSLNIKCEELMDPDFSEFLIGNISRIWRSNGHGITLEILESSALDSEDANILGNLKKLKMYGFHFALDDFRGTDEDYDKFNKLRMIHIPKNSVNEFGTQSLEYFEIEDINNLGFVDSNIASVEMPEVSKNLPIFGIDDEIKFDYTNKETLQIIHDMTKSWPSEQITLKNISVQCNGDVTSPVLRLVNIVSYCKRHHIKYTIEQIRDRGDDHLLRIANLLGFIIQGYIYHKPSPVTVDDTGVALWIAKKTLFHVDILLS